MKLGMSFSAVQARPMSTTTDPVRLIKDKRDYDAACTEVRACPNSLFGV
jgi:hypothetical protein